MKPTASRSRAVSLSHATRPLSIAELASYSNVTEVALGSKDLCAGILNATEFCTRIGLDLSLVVSQGK